MIVIIDYGMGNLRSVQKAFERLKLKAIISSDAAQIKSATMLILPGVGYFKRGMQNLSELKLIEVLNDKVIKEGTPILGICLGMQLFTSYSEEGNSAGLNWIEGNTIHFKHTKSKNYYKIPHMGWNNISIKKNDSLLEDLDETNSFYFVHSYYVQCVNRADVIATTDYGLELDSVIRKNNIYGTQFHPEKSHQSGLKIIQNFIGEKSNI